MTWPVTALLIVLAAFAGFAGGVALSARAPYWHWMPPALRHWGTERLFLFRCERCANVYARATPSLPVDDPRLECEACGSRQFFRPVIYDPETNEFRRLR